ncbi:MAG: hypothetical protein L0Y66_27800, partial [Myxococcaceae bacterium]|nr:hypothetical protein [Myxococcaceae bacterium]
CRSFAPHRSVFGQLRKREEERRDREQPKCGPEHRWADIVLFGAETVEALRGSLEQERGEAGENECCRDQHHPPGQRAVMRSPQQ